MSVYFATCREANAVKIGHSLEPWSRLADLQIGCPLPMTIEAVLPGGFEEEQQYHGRFSEHRIHGEWFRITDIIELMIEQNPAPPPPAKQQMRENRRERSRAKRRAIELEPFRARYGLNDKTDRRRYEAALAEMRAAQPV